MVTALERTAHGGPILSQVPPLKKALVEVLASPLSAKKCVHDVSLPPGFHSSLDEATHGTIDEPVYRGPMAKRYPFKLDPFQETSVAVLERRESVLVSAHTSAGKTVVAEYAIAMAFRDKQRVIYTSPLKVF